MPETTIAALREWWPFGVFLIGGWVSFLIGKERQRWRVDQIGIEVSKQGARIDKLEAQGQAEAVTLGEIKVTQELILAALSNLRDDLKGKADK